MRGTLGVPLERRFTKGVALAAVAMAGLVASASSQTTTQPKTGTPASEVAPDATVEQLFTDFLHYAKLGQFTAADAHARALLAHPDLDPVELMELANKDRKSVDTLLTIIKNSSISERARRVLEEILRHLGVHAAVNVRPDDDHVMFDLSGDSSGVLIRSHK